jgi:tetratricopeptide (TPR) repeat protein
MGSVKVKGELTPMKTETKYTKYRTDGMQAFANEDYEKSVAMFSRYLEHVPEDTITLLSRGSAHLKLEQPESAAADFTRVIQAAPNNARALHLRGLAREKQDLDEQALEDFDRAIEHDPQYGAAYLSRSHLLAKMGRVDQAVEDRKMVTHLTQRNLEAFANDHNVWQTRHMQVESGMETELNR